MQAFCGPIRIVKPGYGRGVDVIANSSYRVIATVHAGNGLTADAHDFTITPQGTALITAYRRIPYDLSSLGGSKHGTLLDSLVQVIDISTGRVLSQWDPLKHVPLTDSYVTPVKGQLYDPYHVNSVALDGSGDLLVSLRHTWTLYKVDLKTGGIVWRMGGKRSQFTVGPGASFAWQHAAFPLPAGQLLVFDNEAAATQAHAATSQGLVLQVDETSRTVTLIHRFVHPGVLASSQGDVQALPGGDYLVGWGAAPFVSEYFSSGSLVWEARFRKTDQSYRAFKYLWTGHSVQPPAVVAHRAAGGAAVSMSWNGATQVAEWQVLAGPTRTSLHAVATVARTGFETTATAPRAAYYEVRPLAADGHALGASGVVGVTPAPAPVASPSPSP